jgi:putative membrane protein
LTTASSAGTLEFRDNQFLRRLCGAFAAVFVISAIYPDKVFDWFLENALVSVFLVVLVASYRRLPLSDVSYLLIFVFLSIHEWGAHYKYSDVPLGEWMKVWFHTQRNSYDRVIHFNYGLLLSYPLQEAFMRKVGVRGRWRYLVPIESILCCSAVYEIMEAGMAMVLTPERGEEFVGMQGDIFDSQKDMLMAGLGSAAAMGIVALLRTIRARRARELERELVATTGD